MNSSRRPISRWLPISCALAVIGQFCVYAGTPASEGLRIHLKHGRSMDAIQYNVDGATAHVGLFDGGSIAFPAELVERVEPVPLKLPPQVEPAPAPEPTISTSQQNA